MPSKLIVIEGSDGSGKKTQTDILAERLRKEGKKVEVLDFPNYKSPYGKMIARYLRGELGGLDRVDPNTIAMVYALDRKHARPTLEKWLKNGKIVLCNRYVASNKAHQAAKIKDSKKRKEFIEWIDEIEFEVNKLPRPNLTIFLYVPLKISQKLVDKKGYRAYVKGKKKDLHESNIPYLEEVEKLYLELAKKEKWAKIDCAKSGKMLSKEEVADKVWEKVKKAL